MITPGETLKMILEEIKNKKAERDEITKIPARLYNEITQAKIALNEVLRRTLLPNKKMLEKPEVVERTLSQLI